MKTPIYDALKDYAKRRPSAFICLDIRDMPRFLLGIRSMHWTLQKFPVQIVY